MLGGAADGEPSPGASRPTTADRPVRLPDTGPERPPRQQPMRWYRTVTSGRLRLMRSRTFVTIPALLALAAGLTACRNYEPIAIEPIDDPSASASSGASQDSSPAPGGGPSASASPTPGKPSASPSETPRPTRISDLSVGDCTLENSSAAEGESVSEVSVVNCETPHDREVISIGQSSMSAYDETALASEIDTACTAALIEYMGGTVGDFSTSYMYPSPTAWEAGNHSYYCFATTKDGSQSTGSVKNGPTTTGGSGGPTAGPATRRPETT